MKLIAFLCIEIILPCICLGATTSNTVNSLLREYGSQDRTVFRSICNRPRAYTDVYYVCLYLRYRYNNDAEILLSGIPQRKSELNGLWKTDEDVFKNVTSSVNLPPILNGTGFVQNFSGAIYALMLKGDKEAYGKYFFIYYSADGEFAEGMQDQISGFISKYPKVVLRDWPVLYPYLKHTTLATTEIAYNVADLKSVYKTLCKSSAEYSQTTCHEVMSYLDKISVSAYKHSSTQK